MLGNHSTKITKQNQRCMKLNFIICLGIVIVIASCIIFLGILQTPTKKTNDNYLRESNATYFNHSSTNSTAANLTNNSNNEPKQFESTSESSDDNFRTPFDSSDESTKNSTNSQGHKTHELTEEEIRQLRLKLAYENANFNTENVTNQPWGWSNSTNITVEI